MMLYLLNLFSCIWLFSFVIYAWRRGRLSYSCVLFAILTAVDGVGSRFVDDNGNILNVNTDLELNRRRRIFRVIRVTNVINSQSNRLTNQISEPISDNISQQTQFAYVLGAGMVIGCVWLVYYLMLPHASPTKRSDVATSAVVDDGSGSGRAARSSVVERGTFKLPHRPDMAEDFLELLYTPQFWYSCFYYLCYMVFISFILLSIVFFIMRCYNRD